MTDRSFRHFHWTSSLGAAVPKLLPFLTAIAVIALTNTPEDGNYDGVLAVLSIAGVIAASMRTHYCERYRIENDHLVRRSGFYSTNTTTIPFERVVDINTTQTTIQKTLGLTTLQVQAASDSAIVLPGVKPDVLDELNTRIQTFNEQRRAQNRDVSTALGTSGFPNTNGDEILYQMSTWDCLKLGLVRNTALVTVFTFLIAIQRPFGTRLGNDLGSFVERMIGVSVTDWSSYVSIELAYGFFPWIALTLNHDVNWLPPLVFLSFLGVMFAAAVALGSFVVLRLLYSRFRLSVSNENLEITTRGFISTSRRIPMKKIQFVQRIRTLRHRLLNSESVSIYTTSSSYSENRIFNRLLDWLVPIGRPQTTNRILARVFDHISLESGSWCTAVKSSWQRRLKKHLLIWFPVSIALVLVSPLLVLPTILALPLLVIEAKRFVSGLRYRLTTDAILMERGWWVRKSTLVPLRKIQSVKMTQSFFDVGHTVATLSISTAGSGLKGSTASLPYVRYDEARDVSSKIHKYLQAHPFDG